MSARPAASSMLDDLADEDMLQALERFEQQPISTTAAGASSSSAAAAASSSAAASAHRPIYPAAPATSFNAAFGSFTSSAMYTSIADMPRPVPPPATVAAQSAGPASAAASARPSPGAAAAPALPGVPKQPSGSTSAAHTIFVSPRQRNNPLLGHLANVAWEYGEKGMLPDYVLGETTCALYLSLKYHMLHGNYLQSRLHSIRGQYTTRLILTHVDLEDSELPLQDITRQAFAFGWTVVLAWSGEEMARYLETFKLYDKKTSTSIQERVDEGDLRSKVTEALTMVRSINKTDVAHLLSNFGSFSAIARATREDLAGVPGMGEKKIARLHHVMNQPFITSQARKDARGGGPDGGGGKAMTPEQMAQKHAENVARAREKLVAQQAQQKKGAIQYIGAIPAAMVNAVHQAATPPVSSAPASVAASASSAAPAAPAASSAAASSNLIHPSPTKAPAPTAPNPAPAAQAPIAPPVVYSASDFS